MQALCVLFCFCFDYLYHYFDCCFFSLYSVYVMHTICMGGWMGCSVRCCFHIAMRGITSYNNYNNLIIICIIIHYNNLIIIRFSNYFFQLCPRHIPHISILCVCICTWKNNKQIHAKQWGCVCYPADHVYYSGKYRYLGDILMLRPGNNPININCIGLFERTWLKKTWVKLQIMQTKNINILTSV